MRYIKLFEEISIDKKEFGGNELYTKSKKILEDLVGEESLRHFDIRVDDYDYYVHYLGSMYNRTTNELSYYHKFEKFNDLKDYIYLRKSGKRDIRIILDIIKSTNLDLLFDGGYLISLALWYGNEIQNTNYNPKACVEILRIVLNSVKITNLNKYSEQNILYFALRHGYVDIINLIMKDKKNPNYKENLTYLRSNMRFKENIKNLSLKDRILLWTKYHSIKCDWEHNYLPFEMI
jgi:hypothetical protein